MAGCKILVGDCRHTLRQVPTGVVQCCVTSPPYYRQRDYGDAAQLGQEATVAQYVAELVGVFREVGRALRPDGTLWLNLGDKYGDKQLLGVPWRVALALQADGWFLRSEIIWHKPNAMPGSAQDRPSGNHEPIFLFSKAPQYFYDKEAIKEEARTVWSVPVAGRREGHFAAYPDELALRCIRAGTSAQGACGTCGAGHRRIVARERVPTRPGTASKVAGTTQAAHGNRDPQRHVTTTHTVGWEATCTCPPAPLVPCTVLDPFGGTGTTAAVAVRLGRRAVVCELNPEYVGYIQGRVQEERQARGFGLGG